MLYDFFSGIKKWKFGANLPSSITFEEISFPIIIPDVNNDGVNDLMAIALIHGSLNGKEYHRGSYLILICGKTGHLLGKPANNASCSVIFDLFLDDDSSGVSYTCQIANCE